MFSLSDLDIKGKKVLLRVDFNVPLEDGVIKDDSRIKKALPTIKKILKKKPSKLIIISHLGRPDGEFDPSLSLKPTATRLEEILGKKVEFMPNPRIKNISSLPDKKIIMLENLRFDDVEKKNDDSFAKALASFADYFVFDAFGAAHRKHASVVGVPKYIPSAYGLLMKEELENLDIKKPRRPFVAIVGGAKEDKMEALGRLAQRADKLIIVGVLANTFLKARGHNIGSSKYSEESLEQARKLLDTYEEKIALPVDFIIADQFSENANTRVAGLPDDITGWLIMDIGPYTITGYKKILGEAKTVIWTGPIGVFEWPAFARGTWDIARFLAEKNIKKIIGGGDSADAINNFGLEDKMTHVSTGGGASLQLLAGYELPVIEALEKNYEKFR